LAVAAAAGVAVHPALLRSTPMPASMSVHSFANLEWWLSIAAVTASRSGSRSTLSETDLRLHQPAAFELDRPQGHGNADLITVLGIGHSMNLELRARYAGWFGADRSRVN
jgi:hypothetical protein